MWVLLAFTSAFFLGFYDIAKKKSLNGKAVLSVLFCNTLLVVDSNDFHFHFNCRFRIFLLTLISGFADCRNFNDTEGKCNCIVYCRSIALQGKEPQVKGN